LLSTVQRVSRAEVIIEGKPYSSIGSGLLIFICIEENDTSKIVGEMTDKILNFKILDGPNGVASIAIKDSQEDILVVSQFTLAAITDKGNKPSFHKAAKPEKAKLLYDEFVNEFARLHKRVEQGKFGASMEIVLINKGPVTFNFKI
jgi:D-tyrosyl-tRNA(Tyr) deacylase